MLHKLKNNGYIQWKPRNSIRLTQKGKIIAKQINRNYIKLEEFFKCILKIEDKELLDKLCGGIEHHITPEIVKALDNLLIN